METHEDLLDRISTDVNVLQGQPCIRHLRIPVGMILDSLAEGMTAEDILHELPALERDDIRAALAFAGRRIREEIVPLAATG